MKTKQIRDVQVGDIVYRYLAGRICMPMRVTKVDAEVIYATPSNPPLIDAEWEFDRKTGAEIDEHFQWGPPPKRTGSFITTKPRTGVKK